MANFPTSLDTNVTLPAESASTPLSTNHVIAHQNLQDAVEAIEAKVGVDSSAVTTSHDYKLSGVTGSDKAVSKTGTEVLTNKTLSTGSKILVGSDATGDMYYNSGSGTIARIPVGTDNQILKMNGSAINWEAEATTVNASTTVAGISELATSAEITAGTATGGTGAALVVTPDALAASTPVFNGSGLTSLPNVVIYKNGDTTKNAADASGTQNIAHGCGKTPKFVRITAMAVGSASSWNNPTAITCYNGTTQSSVSAYNNNTNITVVANTFTLNATNTTATQTGVLTFDSTNIIITWTKTNSPAGTYTLMWEAQA